MSKYMKADEVISLFEKYHYSLATRVCEFGEALRELPTVDAEPQWIPVSERLPEVRQWVLCQCQAGAMDVLRRTDDGGWEQPYPKVTYMMGFVIAWMPLPEPYRGGQDE